MTRRLGAAVLAGLAATMLALGGARAADPTNDLFWDVAPTQWNLLQVGAPAAWTVSRGGGVVIGVVDTGVDLTHEDLADKIQASANCVGADGDPSRCQLGGGQDDNGHGTHVSGTAAADTGNAKGVAGMAPDAKLVVAKAVDSAGNGTASDVAAGIRWVISHGAQIVNLSVGNDATSSELWSQYAAAIEGAYAAGAVPVLAAGNTGSTPDYGSLDAIVVGATGPNGQLTGYSDRLDRAKWGIAAPGGASDGNPADDIVSTWKGNQYAAIAGTSMAVPQVSGALALLMAHGFARDGAIARVLATAAACAGCGAGRLDAANALGAPRTTVNASPTSAPARTPGAPTVLRPPAPAPKPAPATTASTPPSSATTAPPPPSTAAPAPTIGLPEPHQPELAAGRPLALHDEGQDGRRAAAGAAIVLLGGVTTAFSLAWRRLRFSLP